MIWLLWLQFLASMRSSGFVYGVRTAVRHAALQPNAASAILATETATRCATPTAGTPTYKNAAARFAAILQQWTPPQSRIKVLESL